MRILHRNGIQLSIVNTEAPRLIFLLSQPLPESSRGLLDGSSSFLDCNAMLYQVSLSHMMVILFRQNLVLFEQLCQSTSLCLGDSILAGFLKVVGGIF